MVRAKFKVKSHETQLSHVNGKGIVPVTTVKLEAVYGGSEENQRFFSATPGGSINLNLVNPETAAHFPLGEEVYVDFSSVPVAVVPA